MPIKKLSQHAVEVAADAWGVDVEDIIGERQNAVFTIPRQAVYLMLRAEGHTLTRIARDMRRSCHTTIFSGVKKAQWRWEHDPEFKALFDQAQEDFRLAAGIMKDEPPYFRTCRRLAA